MKNSIASWMISLSAAFLTATLSLGESVRAESAESFYQQGLQQIQSGNSEGAIEAFKRSTQLNPIFFPAHYNLGLAQRQTGKVQEAATTFYKAIRLDPTFAMTYANLGRSESHV